MKMSVLALSVLALQACAPSLPQTWSWNDDGNSSFSKENREVIRDAFAQICDSVGYCPIEVTDGEMHIVAQNAKQYAKHGRMKTSAAFNDIKDLLEPYGGAVYVNLSMFDKLTYNWQLHVLMHEILHVGLINHEPQGLMSEEFNISIDIKACIDTHTVNRWCQETTCDGLQHSTCVQDI